MIACAAAAAPIAALVAQVAPAAGVATSAGARLAAPALAPATDTQRFTALLGRRPTLVFAFHPL